MQTNKKHIREIELCNMCDQNDFICDHGFNNDGSLTCDSRRLFTEKYKNESYISIDCYSDFFGKGYKAYSCCVKGADNHKVLFRGSLSECMEKYLVASPDTSNGKGTGSGAPQRPTLDNIAAS